MYFIYVWMQPIRNAQRARVKERKYPHRTSRKGYIGLLEEEVIFHHYNYNLDFLNIFQMFNSF